MPGYSDWQLWVLLVALVVLTLVVRSFFLVLPERWQPRGMLERALRAAPLAAIMAITVPEIFRTSLAADAVFSWQTLADPRLLSALVMVLAWFMLRNGLVALLAGCASYLLLLAWLAA